MSPADSDDRITVTLHRQGAAELVAVLDDVLADLSYEISNTDRSTFRDELRARRERLVAVRDAIAAALG